ncbi:hypothetical protein BDP27DRAFT_1318495 [Rhodocollybia butyracea]|uniref:Uncharacterized protein n=1 Tax=Rhodocollybia butyracea TaxID=206335 RepID=A0A9P5Q2L8_9AGAR|nr:hypothetical protein BDP27DRAFT_1318495 [Rhodocollybia butyracea]
MPRLPLLDIIHRSVVYSLAGLTAWTVVSAVMIHRETLQKGRDLIARMEAEESQKQGALKTESSSTSQS